MPLNLGVVKQDGKIVNHRALVKVLINPFLRLIGIQIATKLNKKADTLGRLMITRCQRKRLEFSFDYPMDGRELVKRRKYI